MPRALSNLGRRERQIMDVLVRRGRATAAQVLEDLDDPPSYSAVRGMLRLLEEKGYVRHVWDGPRHVYVPTGDPKQLRRSAARHMIDTFFQGSTESAMVAMLDAADKKLSAEELDRLAELIEKARRNGGRL